MFISHFYLNGNAGLICLFVLRFFAVSLMDCCGIVDKICEGVEIRMSLLNVVGLYSAS